SSPQLARAAPLSSAPLHDALPISPMAVLAREVLVEAERTFRRADALAAEMEPHLRKRYGDSAIYAYTNERAVPPGDVLLAAALAAGISLDEKLGINRQESGGERPVRELRSQMAHIRDEMASLRAGAAGEPAADRIAEGVSAPGPARAERRRQWARQSSAAPPPDQTPPSGRTASRERRG